MVEPWLQLQAQHTAHAQTAAALESTRNAWSQHHENHDARVRYTATYDDLVESLRKRYAEPAPDSWLAASTPSQDQDQNQDQDPDSFPAALDALFARLKARDAEAADIEAMIAREKTRWYRRTLRDAAAGTQAERLMGRQAYLSALEGHVDEGHAANGTTTEAGAAPTNSSSTTSTTTTKAATTYDWAAGADAIHRALTSQAATAPSVDDVLAKLATAGPDAAPRAEAYIDLFLRDPATGALPASCAAAAASLRAGTPLDVVFARLAADAAASTRTGTAAPRAQADQHRRKLAELRRAQAAHLRDKAVKAETRQRRLRQQQQQGPRVDAEVYENLPDGVAVGDVRACALCQVLAGLGVGAQKVYRTPERLAETHDEHIRSEHRCAAAEDCVQLTDEDVDMAGSDEAASPAICKECAETQSHAVVYCSTRCAAAHFRQHRETVHVPGRRRDSSKSVEHDTKDLVFDDDDRSKYHAEDITKFVWTLSDAVERFFKGKNPDVKILSID
ncbi:hypothetical protein HYQ45_003125 [Verticillium longisporum]|uniref:MYND-type zinc finger protein samB n=1 Tax=Verticillium longisporum TaxID=100787 RepID=A0A8I2ZYL9_VERLO|nr:hypothetical protein HYQ45_003125 [Verticillium longisporum]